MNSPVEQWQSRERSSKSAGPDQNADGRIGEKIDHEDQVKRPDIPVNGRVVGRIDHKKRERTIRQNRIESGWWT